MRYPSFRVFRTQLSAPILAHSAQYLESLPPIGRGDWAKTTVGSREPPPLLQFWPNHPCQYGAGSQDIGKNGPKLERTIGL
jgi:hypothetical protein